MFWRMHNARSKSGVDFHICYELCERYKQDRFHLLMMWVRLTTEWYEQRNDLTCYVELISSNGKKGSAQLLHHEVEDLFSFNDKCQKFVIVFGHNCMNRLNCNCVKHKGKKSI